MAQARGLCLASSATRSPEASLWPRRLTHFWEPAGSPEPSDNRPVLARRGAPFACEPGTLCDRKRFTPGWVLLDNAANVPLESCGWATGLSPARGSAYAHRGT